MQKHLLYTIIPSRLILENGSHSKTLASSFKIEKHQRSFDNKARNLNLVLKLFLVLIRALRLSFVKSFFGEDTLCKMQKAPFKNVLNCFLLL